MKPNLVNLNLVFGRIEEIERRGRSFMNTDMKHEINSTERNRFVDYLEEQEKSTSNHLNKPSLGIDSFEPSDTKIPGKKKSVNQSEWDKYVTKYAKEYGVDEDLVRAVIKVESANNSNALSSKGAMGLMQLMPQTAKMLGVKDVWDPEQNIRGGVKYLSQLSDKFNGDVVKMLAGYNAGPGRVDRYDGIPPYAETQNYVKKILSMLSDENE